MLRCVRTSVDSRNESNASCFCHLTCIGSRLWQKWKMSRRAPATGHCATKVSKSWPSLFKSSVLSFVSAFWLSQKKRESKPLSELCHCTFLLQCVCKLEVWWKSLQSFTSNSMLGKSRRWQTQCLPLLCRSQITQSICMVPTAAERCNSKWFFLLANLPEIFLNRIQHNVWAFGNSPLPNCMKNVLFPVEVKKMQQESYKFSVPQKAHFPETA